MKKTISSVIAISFIAILSGCSQPDSKKTYSANQKVYSCEAYEVILTGGSKTVHGVKETGRDSTGSLTYKGTSKRIAGRITIDSWAMKPYNTNLLSDGTFRMNNSETWSFRKQKNGKYFLGLVKYPNTKHKLGLAGSWCERVH